MDIKTFKERCEGVIHVDELPPLSQLRQKVAGCYAIFGMCPEGEAVALDMDGNVNCLRAEIGNKTCICEDNGLPCRLEAKRSDILGVNELLRNFLVENFLTKKGILAKGEHQKGSKEAASGPEERGKTIGKEDYEDEDLGISLHLAESGKEKRRRAVVQRSNKKNS
jgi:hypothetical protein